MRPYLSPSPPPPSTFTLLQPCEQVVSDVVSDMAAALSIDPKTGGDEYIRPWLDARGDAPVSFEVFHAADTWCDEVKE